MRYISEIQNERKRKAMGHRYIQSGDQLFSSKKTQPFIFSPFRAFLFRALSEPVIIYPTP